MSKLPDHDRPHLSTGEAAALLAVSQQSVIRMVDRGDLKGFRVQTGKRNPHRRVLRASVYEKMREWGLPVPGECPAPPPAPHQEG